MSEHDKTPFPWHLGVFDAHCHPTDTLSSLSDIPSMKARVLTVMATRAQDQDLVTQAADDLAKVDYLQHFHRCGIVPSFGWHPWFSHQLYDEKQYDNAIALSPSQKTHHYQSVLTPPPSEAFISSLPAPRRLSSYLSSARQSLIAHPHALLGEIGLDRGFRLPEPWDPSSQSERDEGLTPGGREGRRLSPHRVTIEHQRLVLQAQLRLAGELQRAVSVHGVQAHGLLHDALEESWGGPVAKQKRKAFAGEDGKGGEKLPFPPRVCLHSYSGPPDTVKQYLRPGVPVEIFFSFSIAINFQPPTARVEDAIRAVPDDRVLVESDLHTAGERMDAMLEDIVRKICELKEWGLEDGVQRLRDNWKRFVLGT
ncbi:hypothetical protein ANO11243_042880 [Dothideomycetidae sp. 11243]|nr:hypothetical protein ANO11243_042880 [fungal sp. No.11243]